MVPRQFRSISVDIAIWSRFLPSPNQNLLLFIFNIFPENRLNFLGKIPFLSSILTVLWIPNSLCVFDSAFSLFKQLLYDIDCRLWYNSAPMSLKSLIQEMRSRSRRVVQDGSAAEVGDGLAQSCWAYMPQELLREVLIRIESSENAWPPRKSVVACAGVCRSWRRITKEIVKTPEVSGRLTFPISVKQVWDLKLFRFPGFTSLLVVYLNFIGWIWILSRECNVIPESWPLFG